MLLEYFQNMATGIKNRIAADPTEISGRKIYAYNIALRGAEIFSKSVPLAWTGVLVPFDLLNAFGVASIFPEFTGAMLASVGSLEPYLQKAESAGFGPDMCAYHRSVYGAEIAGILPEPDFLIGTSGLCVGGLATVEHLARKFNKELFLLDTPNSRGIDAEKRYADGVREMVGFIENNLGRKLDPERLRTAVELTNEAREHLVELYRLAASVPSPARIRDLESFGIVVTVFLGLPAGVQIAKTFANEFAAKVRNGDGEKKEKFRLLWVQNRIQYKNPITKILDDHGAKIVADELNLINWDPIDPDDPYIGFAKRALGNPLVGDASRRVKLLAEMAERYQVDGAINPCHFGCRQGAGARGLVESALKEVGIPVLNLEVDCVDERNYSDGPIRTRIEAFLEMLEGRK